MVKDYLGHEKEWLINFVEEVSATSNFDYFIFGHRHLPIDYKLKNNSSRYINTGDWLVHQSYAEFDGQQLNLCFYKNEHGKIFLSLGILVAPVLGTGQTFKLELKDSLPYQVNEIYIDRLNQIYLFPSGTTDLIKFNEDLSLNQKVSSPFFSQYIFLDVKDPMKLLLYLAQFNNVNLYDESLAAIAEEYFADFSIESSVCFYSSTQLCFFANNRINIKNILDKSVNRENSYFTHVRSLIR